MDNRETAEALGVRDCDAAEGGPLVGEVRVRPVGRSRLLGKHSFSPPPFFNPNPTPLARAPLRCHALTLDFKL